MRFLRTADGRISERWIIRLRQQMHPTSSSRQPGDWEVTYAMGSGVFEAHAKDERVREFLGEDDLPIA